MKFIGRRRELAQLQKMVRSPRQEISLLYGRRRVGKSELLKYFLKSENQKGLYYECKQTSELNNMESLAAIVSDVYGYPPLKFSGMEALLDFLFQKAENEKIILILDEYPYLQKTMKGLDSILQSLIDRYAATSQMKLILCGSFVDTMKNLLLPHNPLYGRISLTINLKPMDYYESAAFYPSFSLEDRVRLFSVFGGIPYYNQLIDAHASVRENIIELLASPGARLENEVLLYLHSELSKFNNANEAFEAMSRSFSKYSDILAQSHISSGAALAEVLKKLMLMEMVSKESPINDPNNKKKAAYTISDNMSLFYYRYIFRFSSQLRIMNPEVFYDRYIAKDFEESYVPHRFELLCRQFLIRQNLLGNMPEPFDAIGKYYYDLPKEHKNGEFDVVTHDPRGYSFYEAKFRKEPVTAAMIEQEIRQVQNTGLACYQYGFFSRSGYGPVSRPDTVLYTLEDLYR